MSKLSIEDLDFNSKNVVMRVDFNVPLKDGTITDDNRILQALPSIKYIIEKGGKVILLSHLGRPKGEPDPAYSLKPVADYLSKKVEAKVHFCDESIGDKALSTIDNASFGDIVLLENVRFHAGETKNDPELSKAFASLGDVYVNDAFGSSHRAHCSVAGITDYLQPAAAGYLLNKEIKFLSESVNNPERPFVAVLGGAKVSDKIGVIENLLEKSDKLLIGGGMSYTFMKAQGLEIGSSLVEEDKIPLAKELLEKGKGKLILPTDYKVTKEFSNDAEIRVAQAGDFNAEEMGLDIGPDTLKKYQEILKEAKTVVWNGPVGVFEFSNFAHGTIGILKSLAALENTTTILGGGDSAAAAISLGYEDAISHISTGGGASLEYLEGKDLPGIKVLGEK